MKRIRQINPAILMLTAAAIFWGLNFHLAKIMLSYVSFVESGFWRYVLGVGFLFFLQLRSRTWIPLADIRKGIKVIMLIGWVGLLGFNLCFFLGMQYTDPLNAALIVSLNPGTTLLMDHWLLKSPINRQQKIGMSVALLGVVYLLTKGHMEQLLELRFAKGDLLIFSGNVVFALHNVWVKKYAGAYSNLVFTFLTNVACLLGFVILLFFVGIHTPSIVHVDFWLSILGIGILGTGLAYLFWNKGVQQVGPSNAGLYMNVVPLATAVFAIFFGGQLYMYHLVSGCLILLGLFFVQRKQVEAKKTNDL